MLDLPGASSEAQGGPEMAQNITKMFQNITGQMALSGGNVCGGGCIFIICIISIIAVISISNICIVLVNYPFLEITLALLPDNWAARSFHR